MADRFKVGDAVRVPGYGFPMYISELNGIQATLHPAWQDEKKDRGPGRDCIAVRVLELEN